MTNKKADMITPDRLLTQHNANLAAVDAEMFRRYDRRYTDYRRQYAAAGRLEYEPDFPLYIMLEQTYRCNLRCPSCIHGMPQKGRFNTAHNVMPRETFDKIILEGEKFRCPSVAFMVNDEPLLVKDLPERVAFAREHGFMDLFITTNGNLLYPGLMKQLIEAGITRILFSLDAATAEIYKKVRPGGDFAQVVENLKALLEYKKKNGLVLPAVRASFVASALNEDEHRLFIKEFSGWVDYVEIQTFSSYYDVNTGLIPKAGEAVRNLRCSEPWRKLIIRANGDVLPCCSFYGYEIVLGNCLKEPLKDIFSTGLCGRLRREFKEGIYSLPPCAACARSFYKVNSAEACHETK